VRLTVTIGAGLAALVLAGSTSGTVLARSEAGRAIVVTQLGAASAARRILVVGCIHGNEPAGISIARRLAALRPPKGAAVWIASDANPDGVAAGTRGNADGVDLNRNFAWRWRPLGGIFDSGPHPFSEPESQALARLVRRVRPTIALWFHQHLGAVDASGGSVAVERRYARLVGLPLLRLTRYPGSAVGWENHIVPRGTAFVVELRAGALTSLEADRYARSILMLA
jgi:murein peptide amidase A